MYITKTAQQHLKALSAFSNNKGMLKYCRANLTRLGKGSSREVFALSDTLVVKVATGSLGVKQNENEIRIWNLVDYSFTGMKRSFAKVLIDECHWNDIFIVMERLEKLPANSSTGRAFNWKALQAWRSDRKGLAPIAKRLYSDVQNVDDNAFTNNIADITPRNMGTSKSGVVKLLDYGFSTQIWTDMNRLKLHKVSYVYA